MHSEQETGDWMGNKIGWRARLRRRFRRRAGLDDGTTGHGHSHGHSHGRGHGPHGQGPHGQGQGWQRGDGAGPHFTGPSLNDLKPGNTARIRALHGRGPIRQRLLDLGLVPGATITVIRCAPLRDPIEVRVGDSFLTLRRAEAVRIEVVHA